MPDINRPELEFSVEERIGIITINRPAKLNSFTPEMSQQLLEALDTYESDPSLRVLVITGQGEKAFCAGSDIRELDSYKTAWQFRNRPDYCDAVRKVRKPVICAINGYCLGGGLEFAMSCDVRLASQNAKFAAPEIKLGWIGGGGMAYSLVHSIGPSNAALMLLTGEMIDADTALRWGLVTEVLPQEGLMPRAKSLAQLIAERPPIAAETAKVNLRAAFALSREEAIQYERDLQTICFATSDAAEGRQAFKEKRQGVFHGK
ncbi:MAG: enoyl-CoA hydratase/isomerase family protein [Verrucomicrobia bacterium]|nr:enoyl-CoA hydratase/isomerase family protein [Verrucomicrobiota bacterium]